MTDRSSEGPGAEGRLDTELGRPRLTFQRRLPYSIERVWRAITGPEELANWFPARVEAEQRTGGDVRFAFSTDAGADAALWHELIERYRINIEPSPRLDGKVTAFEPPTLFAFSWGEDELRFQLSAEPGGCLLVFSHTFADREKAWDTAAGWDVCLDKLADGLAGRPVDWSEPRRWEQFYLRYREILG